ncbi:MAG: hypothetical protein KY476_25875 [Planctomycetes bacterium]|nr:hypothetical protein [Planctomycetota bacterium]
MEQSCEVCGRATESVWSRVCRECSELLEPTPTSNAARSSRCLLTTLSLVAAGAAVYYFVGRYFGRDIFWWLMTG